MQFTSNFRKSKQIQVALQSTNTFKMQGAMWWREITTSRRKLPPESDRMALQKG